MMAVMILMISITVMMVMWYGDDVDYLNDDVDNGDDSHNDDGSGGNCDDGSD